MYALSTYLALHKVWHDGRIVPHKRRLGVWWIGADLLVCVAEGATQSLWEANLLTGVKEVLTLENIIGRKLTKVLLGGNLAWEKGGCKTNTAVLCAGAAQVNAGALKVRRSVATTQGVSGLLSLLLAAEKHPHNHRSNCDKEEGLAVTELHHIYYTMDNFFLGT
tara:strand:- start:14898 stop:15389 length:492 start_codon:yes stop_codon:yes gene_type:complete